MATSWYLGRKPSPRSRYEAASRKGAMPAVFWRFFTDARPASGRSLSRLDDRDLVEAHRLALVVLDLQRVRLLVERELGAREWPCPGPCPPSGGGSRRARTGSPSSAPSCGPPTCPPAGRWRGRSSGRRRAAGSRARSRCPSPGCSRCGRSRSAASIFCSADRSLSSPFSRKHGLQVRGLLRRRPPLDHDVDGVGADGVVHVDGERAQAQELRLLRRGGGGGQGDDEGGTE